MVGANGTMNNLSAVSIFTFKRRHKYVNFVQHERRLTKQIQVFFHDKIKFTF